MQGRHHVVLTRQKKNVQKKAVLHAARATTRWEEHFNISEQLADALGCVSACTGLFPMFLCCTVKRSVGVCFVSLWQIQYDCADGRFVNLQVCAQPFKRPAEMETFLFFDVAVMFPRAVRQSAACSPRASSVHERGAMPSSQPRPQLSGPGRSCCHMSTPHVPRQHGPSISVHWSVPMMAPEKAC